MNRANLAFLLATPINYTPTINAMHLYSNVHARTAHITSIIPIFFEPDESAESFAMHNASWHKSCFLKYITTLHLLNL